MIRLEVEQGLDSAVILGTTGVCSKRSMMFANARRLGSGRMVDVQIARNNMAFVVRVEHPAPGLTAAQCEQLMETASVLDLRDDNVPVAAGGG